MEKLKQSQKLLPKSNKDSSYDIHERTTTNHLWNRTARMNMHQIEALNITHKRDSHYLR